MFAGMAFQKYTGETWWERYSEDLGIDRFDDEEFGDNGPGDDPSDDSDSEEDEGNVFGHNFHFFTASAWSIINHANNYKQ